MVPMLENLEPRDAYILMPQASPKPQVSLHSPHHGLGKPVPGAKRLSTAVLQQLCNIVQEVGLPSGSAGKNPPANAEGMGSIPGLARSPGGGNGNLFQYSCWENRMDREAWWATVHGVGKKSEMT